MCYRTCLIILRIDFVLVGVSVSSVIGYGVPLMQCFQSVLFKPLRADVRMQCTFEIVCHVELSCFDHLLFYHNNVYIYVVDILLQFLLNNLDCQ